MAALTSSRNTPEMADLGRMQAYPVEANTVVYLGSMVALNADGNAVPAAPPRAADRGPRRGIYIGIPAQNADNTSSVTIPGTDLPAGAAGAISVICRRGVFMYAVNDESIAQAQVGMLCVRGRRQLGVAQRWRRRDRGQRAVAYVARLDRRADHQCRP